MRKVSGLPRRLIALAVAQFILSSFRAALGLTARGSKINVAWKSQREKSTIAVGTLAIRHE